MSNSSQRNFLICLDFENSLALGDHLSEKIWRELSRHEPVSGPLLIVARCASYQILFVSARTSRDSEGEVDRSPQSPINPKQTSLTVFHGTPPDWDENLRTFTRFSRQTILPLFHEKTIYWRNSGHFSGGFGWGQGRRSEYGSDVGLREGVPAWSRRFVIPPSPLDPPPPRTPLHSLWSPDIISLLPPLPEYIMKLIPSGSVGRSWS